MAIVTTRIEKLCRRNRLFDEDAEDFGSYAWVRLLTRSERLEVLFEGRSNAGTYFDKILSNILKDYRIQNWGKWRASTTARRKGALVMKLERMVYRDRMRPADAIRTLVHTAMSEREREDREELLWRSLAELPIRVDRRPVEAPPNFETKLASTQELNPPDLLAAVGEIERLRTVLLDALLQLSSKQRRVLRLRYAEGLSFAEIESRTGDRTDSLYRLVARALRKLRKLVAAQGLEANEVLGAHASGAGDFCLERLFAIAQSPT